MKISTHIFYITYKIVYEFGTDTYRAVLEKLRFEEKVKKILNLKYLWNLWTNHFVQRTLPRTIQNLPLQEILRRLSQF